MPTRRSNRLRAAALATPANSATPDVTHITPAVRAEGPAVEVAPVDIAPVDVAPVDVAPVVTEAPTAATAISTAATSRRARRLAASGTPVVQPMTAPAEIIAETAAAATPTVPELIAVRPETAASGVDAFAEASEAFGFAPADGEAAAPASDSTATNSADTTDVHVADEPVVEGAAPAHIAPRRPRRMLRRVVAAGASFGVMGVAGLIAVSMTLPVSAVAASQGADARAAASLVAPGENRAPKVSDDEIQAYVASSDVEGEALARSESFSTVSLSEVAAEEGIKFSESLYTNDPDAAIQWPFIVGVAMSSPYGQRWGRLHAGIDLVPGNGAPIQAIADGVVRTATEAGGAYGVNVYIDHVIDGQVVTSHYAHMQYGSLQVQAGQKVKVGDIIGRVGNTGRSYGAHLHFEIIINGSTIDPLPWMRENAGRYEY
ncbi:M23 family metallopeptidase [Microbacterium sp. Mu-80]|uniref:M23 family metallopeptidase n=1 Tax=Microbacterium bandirmense TaxID=3122050 RepID=A0ABU8LB44_9MICO